MAALVILGFAGVMAAAFLLEKSDWNNGISRHSGTPNGHDMGMTLRDYFAGQAMAGLCAHPEAGELPNDGIACLSFALADAMLKARESAQ